MNYQLFIKAANPSPKSKKLIAEAKAQVHNLMEIVMATEPDRHGRTSQLHIEADRAEKAFLENPSVETANRFHYAVMRHESAKHSFSRIDQAVHVLLPQASKVAEPAAMDLIDNAIADLEKQASETKANISKSETVFVDLASVDRQLMAAKASLEGERVEARRDPLGWLRQHGHA